MADNCQLLHFIHDQNALNIVSKRERNEALARELACHQALAYTRSQLQRVLEHVQVLRGVFPSLDPRLEELLQEVGQQVPEPVEIPVLAVGGPEELFDIAPVDASLQGALSMDALSPFDSLLPPAPEAPLEPVEDPAVTVFDISQFLN